MAGPALAHKAGDVIVRLGGIKVDPDASSEVFNPALPAVGGLGVDVDDDTQLGLTLLPMTSFWIPVAAGWLSAKPGTCRPRCWHNTMPLRSGPCGLIWAQG